MRGASTLARAATIYSSTAPASPTARACNSVVAQQIIPLIISIVVARSAMHCARFRSISQSWRELLLG